MAKFNTRSIFTTASKFIKKLLTQSQKLFNSSVKDGNYNLQKRVDDSPWNIENSKTRDEVRDWMKSITRDKENHYKTKFLEAGKLYFFRYMKPKHMDTLDYWDKGPLMLCLGGYWTKDKRWIEVGLNLHLLPPLIRRKVLVKVWNMYSQKYKGEMYSPTQRPLELNWQKVAGPLLQYGAGFCFRSYIPELRTQTIEFKYEDWDKAIYVPNEYLNKTSEAELKVLWAKFTRDKALSKLSGNSLERVLSGLER